MSRAVVPRRHPRKIDLLLLPRRVIDVITASSGKEKQQNGNFTIDTENNIAAHAAVPANLENLQSFACEKDLAKLAAEWPGSRLVGFGIALRAWRRSRS